MITRTVDYTYKNAPIPGGGYVTGFVFHKKYPNILYARTDIGGVYRYIYEEKRWKSLSRHVTMTDLAEVFPIAIALSDYNPGRICIMSGTYIDHFGKLSISDDYGETFRHVSVPTKIHGNLSGRGTGMRLVTDKRDDNILYFASQTGGLLKTCDLGKTWEKLPVPEDYLTMVWVSDDGNTIVVGGAGLTTRLDDKHRGHSMYVSYDGGASFAQLMEPDNDDVADCRMNGLVASRYDYDGKYLYVTFNSTGRFNYIVDLGYSCDTGDVINGHVVRYVFTDGRITGFADITPADEHEMLDSYRWRVDYGYGGVCSHPDKPGFLTVTTLCREIKKHSERVYVSDDYGNTWKIALDGLSQGGMHFNTSYMLPEHNGGNCIIHWLSDIKVNPFNINEAWFNSGTGVFGTDAFLSDNPAFHDICEGIEETVHLNVYAPLDGEVKLVDIVGDLGGFAFKDLDKPCRNSFDDADGNRYITCINADISDSHPEVGIITARGNWTGKTKGGLIRTRDGFNTFERMKMPYGINDDIDAKLKFIEHPNVNAGWVAMSDDTNNIVWSIADIIFLPADSVVCSQDGGNTYKQVRIYDIYGQCLQHSRFKAMSDRVDNNIFYGFGENSSMYISTDGGQSFYEKRFILKSAEGKLVPVDAIDFGKIDTANRTEIRVESGKQGVIYIATGRAGLWKVFYNPATDVFEGTRLSKLGDEVYRVGLGLIAPGSNYLTDNKAVYMCATIDGEYGFFRSFDDCRTCERINNESQMFGEINSIDGDKRTFGRFFIASGSHGVIYGEEFKY